MSGGTASLDRHFLEALLDFSDDALCFFNSESLVLVAANAAASKLVPSGTGSCGPSLQEVVTTALNSQNETVVDELLKRCATGETYTVDGRSSLAPALSAKRHSAGSVEGILVKLKPSQSAKFGVLRAHETAMGQLSFASLFSLLHAFHDVGGRRAVGYNCNVTIIVAVGAHCHAASLGNTILLRPGPAWTAMFWHRRKLHTKFKRTCCFESHRGCQPVSVGVACCVAWCCAAQELSCEAYSRLQHHPDRSERLHGQQPAVCQRESGQVGCI